MAYQIVYGPPFPKRKDKHPLRLVVLTAGFFVLFLLGVKVFWPAGREKLIQLLLPFLGNADFRQAVQTFVSDIKSGATFYQSLTAFCQEIINHADIPPV